MNLQAIGSRCVSPGPSEAVSCYQCQSLNRTSSQMQGSLAWMREWRGLLGGMGGEAGDQEGNPYGLVTVDTHLVIEYGWD